jgi:hypothetical protein
MLLAFDHPCRSCEGLFTLFPGDALLVKKVMRKARNAAGVDPRQGFVTRSMAFFFAATPQGNGPNRAPLVVPRLARMSMRAAAGAWIDARLSAFALPDIA